MSYKVRAKRWRGGWELHIDGEGVTQARSLQVAERAVRDYLATMHDVDEVTDEVVIVPEIDQRTRAKIASVKKHQAEVEARQRLVAAESRQVVRELRQKGLSVSDVAAVLHISRGRVSQLDTSVGRSDSLREG